MLALDLSRLLSRAGQPGPTGIDRVELAYARHFVMHGEALGVVATSYGSIWPIGRAPAVGFIAALAEAWHGEAAPGQAVRKKVVARARRLRLAAAASGWRGGGRPPDIYLLVSHHHLDRPTGIVRLKRRGSRFVCLVHDLIPIEYPEYARAGQALRHGRRIRTAAELADVVIVASTAVRDALSPHLERAGRRPPVLIAPFGVDLEASHLADPTEPPEPPYFVCVGTIEPRKNHAMLLAVWRRLAAERGEAAPRLALVGRRGWEISHVTTMLDRTPALRGNVTEHGVLPDTAMLCLLQGARALLMPSFAEGFGFPVAEALALGVPVLCSDLPALRETGGSVPDYLDPLDGTGWRDAVLDFADEPSPRRTAQLKRLATWRRPHWADHFCRVEAMLAELDSSGGGRQDKLSG